MRNPHYISHLSIGSSDEATCTHEFNEEFFDTWRIVAVHQAGRLQIMAPGVLVTRPCMWAEITRSSLGNYHRRLIDPNTINKANTAQSCSELLTPAATCSSPRPAPALCKGIRFTTWLGFDSMVAWYVQGLWLSIMGDYERVCFARGWFGEP